MPSPTSEHINEVIRAGAGAGKTTALTNSVLNYVSQYIEEHKKFPKLVVTTFTKKATEELRERLLYKACEAKNSELIDFVISHSHLHISTIHGVLTLFLRRYGHLMGIDSGFNILDSFESKKISRKIIRDLLVLKSDYKELLEYFTVNQLTDMSCDYFATKRVHGEMLPLSEQDLTTYVDEERHRVAKLLNAVAVKVQSEETNPKWMEYAAHLTKCAHLLSEFMNISGAEWYERLDEVSKPRYMTKTAQLSPDTHAELTAVLDECEVFDSEVFSLKSIQFYAQIASLFGEFAEDFSASYLSKKTLSGQIEMSDLEFISLESVRAFPELANAFAADWDFWLIDEFQDTSPVQVELLNKLSGNKRKFIVGDPQQSIYLFRGARSEIFAEEEKKIVQAGGERRELKINYRAKPELLHFLNDFFKKINPDFHEMEPRTEISDAKAEVATFCLLDKGCDDPLLPLAEYIFTKMKMGAQFDHFSVLAKTNRELQSIAKYFEALNIPTHIHSSDGFYSRREIVDTLSVLKFLVNPYDNHNLIRLLRSPWCKIEDDELIKMLGNKPIFYWLTFSRDFINVPAIEKLYKTLEDVSRNGIYESLKKSVIEWGILDSSHIHDPSGRRESNIWKLLNILKENESQPGHSYHTFLQKVFSGSRSAEGDDESDAVAALEPNRVNLLTIHKSKGLKFKHVLLPNLHKRPRTSERRKYEQLFVFNEQTKQFTLGARLNGDAKIIHNTFARKIFAELSEREASEQMRVLYVAMTRAEESLLLHWIKPPDSNSLAAKINLDLNEGVHTSQNYTYRVAREFSPQTKFINQAVQDTQVRSLYVENKIGTDFNNKRISVSQLLEDSFIEKSNDSAMTTFEVQKSASDEGVDIEKLSETLMRPVIGQRLHLLFERMKYSKDFDVTGYIDKWFAKKSNEFKSAVNYVLNLGEPPVRKLIELGEVEWGFQLQTSIGTLEGQIDLWGTVGETTWVIDYKTGSSRYTEKAFDQLNIYAYALRKYGIKNKIKLAAIYTNEQHVEIREALSDSVLEKKFSI